MFGMSGTFDRTGALLLAIRCAALKIEMEKWNFFIKNVNVIQLINVHNLVVFSLFWQLCLLSELGKNMKWKMLNKKQNKIKHTLIYLNFTKMFILILTAFSFIIIFKTNYNSNEWRKKTTNLTSDINYIYFKIWQSKWEIITLHPIYDKKRAWSRQTPKEQSIFRFVSTRNKKIVTESVKLLCTLFILLHCFKGCRFLPSFFLGLHLKWNQIRKVCERENEKTTKIYKHRKSKKSTFISQRNSKQHF